MSIEDAYRYFNIAVLIMLAVFILLVFVRVIKGPRLADRIVGINSVGTLVICTVCLLAGELKEDYLLDVAILYALISFLAVVVLTKIYSGVYKNRIEQQRLKHEREAAGRAALEEAKADAPSAAAGDLKVKTGNKTTVPPQ